MSNMYPVGIPDSGPAQLVPAGAILPVVIPDDLVLEFGSGYPDIDQLLLDTATRKCEEIVKRPLREGVYTEQLRILYDGYVDAIFGTAGSVRPSAIPVREVVGLGDPTNDNYTAGNGGTIIIDNVEIRYVPPDDTIEGFWALTWIEQYGTVTYRGGWTRESLPSELRTVILKVAVRMLQRRQGAGDVVPAPGVTSMHVGDVSITVDPKLYGSLLDASDYHTLKKYIFRSLPA
jgi:hypothetical protein